MVDREIVFVDELTGEIRRRFINNLVDQQMPNLGGGQFRERERRQLDFVVDDRRDLVLVRPVADSGRSRGGFHPVRSLLGCGREDPATLGLVPVRPSFR